MKPSMMISRRWRLIKTREHTLLRCQHSRSYYSISREIVFFSNRCFITRKQPYIAVLSFTFSKVTGFHRHERIERVERANKLNPLTNKGREVDICTPRFVQSFGFIIRGNFNMSIVCSLFLTVPRQSQISCRSSRKLIYLDRTLYFPVFFIRF